MRYSITAIIYDKRGRVLSIGHNSYVKTHPIQSFYANKVGLPHKVFLHAEVDAILKLGKNFKKAYKISVFRFNNQGKPLNAKPCPICMEYIRHTSIKYITHT